MSLFGRISDFRQLSPWPVSHLLELCGLCASYLPRPCKNVENIPCYSLQMSHCCSGSLDSLSVSRSGKSSGELSSVMILNPIVGNGLEARVDLQDITKYEYK